MLCRISRLGSDEWIEARVDDDGSVAAFFFEDSEKKNVWLETTT
jgi:hypothetical protein